jgi:hypothetical protein
MVGVITSKLAPRLTPLIARLRLVLITADIRNPRYRRRQIVPHCGLCKVDECAGCAAVGRDVCFELKRAGESAVKPDSG